MNVEDLLQEITGEFFVGVPDSQLKVLCNFLMETKGINKQHIIAANEGNCVGIAAGHYLATGEIPVIYMQNSGIGNIVNPVASLLHPDVYGIPCIFIIGWRGEPGVADEPQHKFQGKITEKLLKDLDIDTYTISKSTTMEELKFAMAESQEAIQEGRSIAFLIKKDSLESQAKVVYGNHHTLVRENVIDNIVRIAEEDILVSTTGKASRELFEIREKYGHMHNKDFLTVGSMGHSSSIALGIALSKPKKKVWCIDGDGAVLMHMGAMALIGANKPRNMVHVVINNEAHETVGGMPTVSNAIKLTEIATACGYLLSIRVETEEQLIDALNRAKEANELVFIEIMCNIKSRKDLGRPTTSPIDNKKQFMEYLKSCDNE